MASSDECPWFATSGVRREIVFYERDFVATGDDSGHLHMWHKRSANRARVVKGDSVTLNGLDYSRRLGVLATCGIDKTVKLFLPGGERHGYNDDTSCADSRTSATELPVSLRRQAMQDRGTLSEPEAHDSLERAEQKKQSANEHFMSGNVSSALGEYDEALSLLAFTAPTASLVRRRNQLRLPLLLNHAQCELKRAEWDRARVDCSEALAIDTNSMKALYRRAQAYYNMCELSEARKDIDRALHENGTHADLRKLKQRIDAMER